MPHKSVHADFSLILLIFSHAKHVAFGVKGFPLARLYLPLKYTLVQKWSNFKINAKIAKLTRMYLQRVTEVFELEVIQPNPWANILCTFVSIHSQQRRNRASSVSAAVTVHDRPWHGRHGRAYKDVLAACHRSVCTRGDSVTSMPVQYQQCPLIILQKNQATLSVETQLTNQA